MRLSPPAFFQNRPANSGEKAAIANRVASYAPDDLDEITFLLCNLSTAERAVILLDPQALVSKIDAARMVITLQGPPPVEEAVEDDVLSPPPQVSLRSLLCSTFIKTSLRPFSSCLPPVLATEAEQMTEPSTEDHFYHLLE